MKFTYGIVASKQDPAGMNIRDKIIKLGDWINTRYYFDNNVILYEKNLNTFLITIDKDIIYSDYLKNLEIPINFLIFVSRHYSESGKPSLHVHFTGNWANENPYGGSPRYLSIAEPILAREIFLKLYRSKGQIQDTKFEISLEVTHHGPTDIDTPLIFVELGSRNKQWLLEKPAELIAKVIIETIKKGRREKYDTAIGVGGPHYAPSFTKYLLEKEIYISHIIPKYHVDNLDNEIAYLMIKRSSTKPKIALIDWKGLKGHQRKKTKDLFESIGLEIIKI